MTANLDNWTQKIYLPELEKKGNLPWFKEPKNNIQQTFYKIEYWKSATTEEKKKEPRNPRKKINGTNLMNNKSQLRKIKHIKMAKTYIHISIINLIIIDLNFPIKSHRLNEWVKNKICPCVVYKKLTLFLKIYTTWMLKDNKIIINK